MPASWASAGVGYWQPTHLRSPVKTRSIDGRRDSLATQPHPLRGEGRALTCVLGRVDRDQGVGVLERVNVDGRNGLQQLLGSRQCPGQAAGEVLAVQGVRAAFPEEAGHLVDERPGEGPRGDEHLPAGLDPDTGVDEDACVLLEPRITHQRLSFPVPPGGSGVKRGRRRGRGGPGQGSRTCAASPAPRRRCRQGPLRGPRRPP